ncbi:MAG: 3-isopropylmalate dehydratase small subunit [Alphaproteobacteria bacterium]|nr:3-isopropylmalate dehydratase small subunit [Alphaproteobacteria bacterium]
MEKFTELTGIAVPFPMINVDTDTIIPSRWLKTIKRTGLGVGLFEALRYDDDGSEVPDFVLNKPPYRDAKILVAGANFGCGSSREHAIWALLDFGIRCVIAPVLADIFATNAAKNGVLIIKLPQADVDKLMADAELGENGRLTIDLEAEEISRPDGETIAFEIDPFVKHCLLNGLDDIALTLAKADAIDSFEDEQKVSQPWLYA